MGANGQTLLHDLPTLVAFLRGRAGVHSNDLMTSSCSLIREDVEEGTPGSVHDAFCQGMVLYHVQHVQWLNGDGMVLLCVALGGFVVKVPPLPLDLQVRVCRAPGGLPMPLAALLASSDGPLLASECSLRGAIEARVSNRLPFTIRQEGLQAHVDTDSRMGTCVWSMLGVWFHLTDNQHIPVPVGTQDQMGCLRLPFKGAMQLDLERAAQLLGHRQMLAIRSQQHIPSVLFIPILPQLDGMPPIGFLEAGKATTWEVILFRSEKSLEAFGEAIGQHLYGGGWHMLALPLKSLFQVILGGKRAFVLILRFHRLQHAVIDAARFNQALHELGMLLLIHKKPILKRSHLLYHSA